MQKLQSVTYHFKNFLHFYISETANASAFVWECFVDFDICHRMVSLQKLYSVIVTYFSMFNILKC